MNDTQRMRVALVTSAANGIGHEIARQLLEKGFRVILSGRRFPGDPLLHMLPHEAHAEWVEMDVSSEESILHAAQTIALTHDRLDVLVNNAAILLDGDEGIFALDYTRLFTTIKTNAIGPLMVTRALAPLLNRASEPRVINVSSGGGQLSEGLSTWAPAYCVSKTTLNAITCQLAAAAPQWAVNAVCPGWVRPGEGGQDIWRSAEDSARGIVWLATDAPHGLTGKFWRDCEELTW